MLVSLAQRGIHWLPAVSQISVSIQHHTPNPQKLTYPHSWLFVSYRSTSAACVALQGPLPPAIQAAQIPIGMDPFKVQNKKRPHELRHPPKLGLIACIHQRARLLLHKFYAPDFPQNAGEFIQALLPAVINTQLISLAPALTNSDFFSGFAASCDGGMDNIDIIPTDIYGQKLAGALS